MAKPKIGTCSKQCAGTGRGRKTCIRVCMRGGAKKKTSKRRRSR